MHNKGNTMGGNSPFIPLQGAYNLSPSELRDSSKQVVGKRHLEVMEHRI